MSGYIVSVDQSTTATKAVLFDTQGNLLHRVDRAHAQISPRPGWVEHDGEEIYKNFVQAVKAVKKENNIAWSEISALSISNQRETVIVWERETGRPICNAVVWQCARAKEICERKAIAAKSSDIREITGLELSPYFSAPKIKWILDNVEGAREKALQGKLLAGTMDSFLVWKLTGGKMHVTDYSNSSRTMLFNLKKLDWDEGLLELFDIPRSMMADIVYSDEVAGYTDLEGESDCKIPIAGIMGDSHAAMFAQNCYEKGTVKATYGTGSSIMMNIGNEVSLSRHGLVTSVAWGMKSAVEFVLEGNINYAAASVKWLTDDLGVLENPEQSEEYATQLDGNEGVYLVPAFTGLGAPYWDSQARAMICGMRAGAGKKHFARAALESIAYQVNDVIECMKKDTMTQPSELRADGGPTGNAFLMQFQADISHVKVNPSNVEELSAKGAALMAGLAVGIWKDKNEIRDLRKAGKSYKPAMDCDVRVKNIKGWNLAVKRARMEE